MKSLAAILPALMLIGTSGLAQAGDLDLRLPDTTRFGAPYVPPGTAPPDADPLATQDDGKTHVHGSVTTGIGYTKGYGSTNFNAAHINVSKTIGDEHPTRMNLDIRVSKSNGPGGYYGGFGGYDAFDDDRYDRYDAYPADGYRDSRGRGPAW